MGTGFCIHEAIVLRVEGGPEKCFLEQDMCNIFPHTSQNDWFKFLSQCGFRRRVHGELVGLTFRGLAAYRFKGRRVTENGPPGQYTDAQGNVELVPNAAQSTICCWLSHIHVPMATFHASAC